MKIYIPIIIDRNGKQYENVSYTDKIKAEDALHEFIDSFRSNCSERIKRAYVLTVERQVIAMTKAKYICKHYDRSNDCMCLTYSYRGYEYDVYENYSKGSEPLRWQHTNAQARIDRRIEIEQMASHSDQGMSFDESLEYFFKMLEGEEE